MTTTAEDRSIRRVVVHAGIWGVAAALLVAVLSVTVWSDADPLLDAKPGLPLFVVLATVGQLAYVRVRHGDTDEELTFFEVVLAAAILVLAPAFALVATLLGVLIGEVLFRRPAIKMVYNLGNYAASAGAMVVTYNTLFPPGPSSTTNPFSWQSVLSLMIASMVFTAVNLVILAGLMHAVTGADRGGIFREEWRLSAFMAVGSAAVGAIGVALATNPETRALTPFALLPAVALWYAYGASAQHSEAQERNRWLVTLGGALAQQGQSGDLLEEAGEAIRQIVGAPRILVLSPGDTTPAHTRALQRIADDAGPHQLPADELPAGWYTGVATRLDMGGDEPGALLLGSDEPFRRSRIVALTRGWNLDEADAPVLGALVAAVGSAMRAGAAFNALTEETAKMTAVVDNTSDGIAMVDDAGRVRLWSQTMARMTGVEAGALDDGAGQPPDIVMHLVQASLDEDAAMDRVPVQMHLVRGDGEELDVSVTTVRVRESIALDSADEAGWVSILTVHDETRERRVERMKTDFVATISHELRTPITPIKGYAHLLSTRGERMKPEKRAHALKLIGDRADHLARLVDDLLMASRVSSEARLAVEMGVYDLGDIVHQAIASFPALSSRLTVTLPDEKLSIHCDRMRAIQCLSNLLGNAQKYTPEDSPVDVTAEVKGTQLSISIRDHGPGIPPSEQARVFERFYRREDPFTMRTGGAGLGLHIARELAQAMGGRLTLEDPPSGPGAQFVLMLNVADEQPTGDAGGGAAMDGNPGTPRELAAAGSRPGAGAGPNFRSSPAAPPGDPAMGPNFRPAPPGPPSRDATMDLPDDQRTAAT